MKMNTKERVANDDAWQDAIWCNHENMSCTQELSRMTNDEISRVHRIIANEILHRVEDTLNE